MISAVSPARIRPALLRAALAVLVVAAPASALAPSEKAVQGPRWPQYYSKCVRRLKEQKA